MCPGLRSATAAMAPSSRQEQQPSSYLLELAADDDLQGFRRAVQEDNLSLVASSPWYGPSPRANNALALHLRTPAMVAALYGSTHVLSYVLSIAPSEAARASATDGATPLLLAAQGRAPSAPAAARLLLAAGASPSTPLPLRHHSPTKQQPDSPEKKKKDYTSSANPATPTEDINTGVFCTDEFRMYSFKVNPCSRAYTHDWTECPFAHPGENARRRDPRRHAYTCVPCPDFRRDPAACRKGDACEFAHGVFESWLHPAQYRTRLCKDEVGCPRRICFFAHGNRQLRNVNPSAASMSESGSFSSSAAFASSSSAASFSSSPPPPSRRPALTASLSARDLDFDADHYTTSTRRMMMARATSPPGYSSDLVAAYAQALSSLQLQQQQARNTNKPPMALNSRAAAFANRSQTFVHRSPAPSPAARSFASPSSVLDNWGSPDGKLDWGVHVQAAELRKSTSFGVGGRPQASVRRDQDMYSWLNDGGADVLAAARWSDLEQMVA
ncbi:zinc finger CCCH domain-containing protein 33-like [Lolium rigidum]|uniref:zinc finger CCCH domain-containing protein 33-like n=1 Tax=Lolium rigidum TaxID=89674 RepID=UPI001F5E117D|nr:zinc finger CCCH domain-containing protein 33-like [Lolium rigidum]